MSLFVTLLALVALFNVALCVPFRTQLNALHSRLPRSSPVQSKLSYTTAYFNQYVSHFDLHGQAGRATFQQRYLFSYEVCLVCFVCVSSACGALSSLFFVNQIIKYASQKHTLLEYV